MKLFKSLRIRIIAFALAAGILPIAVIHLLVVSTYESRLIEQRRIDILQRLSVIARQLGDEETLAESLTPEKTETLNWYADAYGGRVLAIDENCRIIHDTYHMDQNRVCVSDAVFSALSGSDYQNYRSGEDLLEFVLPVYLEGAAEGTVTGALVMSSDTSWIRGSVPVISRAMRGALSSSAAGSARAIWAARVVSMRSSSSLTASHPMSYIGTATVDSGGS